MILLKRSWAAAATTFPIGNDGRSCVSALGEPVRGQPGPAQVTPGHPGTTDTQLTDRAIRRGAAVPVKHMRERAGHPWPIGTSPALSRKCQVAKTVASVGP